MPKDGRTALSSWEPPANIKDVDSGRVIRREILDEHLLPSIRGVLANLKEARLIALRGRAGAGISTLLCHAAVLLERDPSIGPIVIADTRVARTMGEWQEAGRLIAEVSQRTLSTVIVVGEASDSTIDGILACVNACLERKGRLAVLIGGRRENFLRQNMGEQRRYFHVVECGDQLSDAECSALAVVLHRNGFSTGRKLDLLAKDLKKVGRLLPAIYQATDRQHRRFKDIIAYEYSVLGADRLVQFAYRLICTLGAFDVPISQYWLLRAMSDRALQEASRILGALSEDLIIEKADSEGNDIIIQPLHRVVAEAIVEIATPEPIDRVQDILRLIGSANLASRAQGMAVAALLYKSGHLMEWVRSSFGDNPAKLNETIQMLYQTALDNQPLHPDVEVHIRQHFALQLRFQQGYDEALTHLERALALDKENSATFHILGLVHEQRAVDSWRLFVRTQQQSAFTRAQSDENDALDLFRTVREVKPWDEHGYEAEARYYHKKRAAIRSGSVPSALEEESRLQVFQGLQLLREGIARVPADLIKLIPETRGTLLASAGNVASAILELQDLIRVEADPVRKLRLLRAYSTLALESERWSEALAGLQSMISLKDRSSWLFLNADWCLTSTGASIKDRMQFFRDSAERFNVRDVETQVRWAEICLIAGYYAEAATALARADGVAKDSISVLERERIRGVIKNEDGRDKRFEGTITRLYRPDEGLLRAGVIGDSIFFRVPPSLNPKLDIGVPVSFSLAWRVRGLRALDVAHAEASGTSGRKAKKG